MELYIQRRSKNLHYQIVMNGSPIILIGVFGATAILQFPHAHRVISYDGDIPSKDASIVTSQLVLYSSYVTNGYN
jgi:hypothetical protein